MTGFGRRFSRLQLADPLCQAAFLFASRPMRLCETALRTEVPALGGLTALPVATAMAVRRAFPGTTALAVGIGARGLACLCLLLGPSDPGSGTALPVKSLGLLKENAAWLKTLTA